MKTRIKPLLVALGLLATLITQISTVRAQGTAFTYQGRLNDGGTPANGVYILQFGLYASATGGSRILAVQNPAVIITNGLFTISLDYGANFPGDARWLEIQVATNGGSSLTTLAPRQQLTPTPYAITAGSLSSLLVQQNTNDAPDLIGGSPNNYVSSGVVGATIAGGGATNNDGNPWPNSVTSDFGTVGGGLGNFAGYVATVGGGFNNNASDTGDTVGGGESNGASDVDSTVGGGDANFASGAYATIAGGSDNSASGDYSFAAGQQAQAEHRGTFVWADSQAAYFASTSSNQFLIRAQGGVGIGNNNPQAPLHITGGGDASLAGGGNLISGQVGGQNLVMDNNEIISRNNGAASDLIVNFGSGNVGIGRTPTANKLEVAGDASKATAGNWLANSDARIKTAVQTVTNALDKLSRVRLVQFRYTDDYRRTHPGVEDREYLNVVAQEFQKVFPEDVKNSGEKLASGDHILQVDTYPLTIYSAAAVQELNQKLKAKDAEIQELKQRLEAVEKIVLNQK